MHTLEPIEDVIISSSVIVGYL